MNDRKDREIIQVALDTTLSGLQDDPWLARKVLDDAKGEVKVKKKISVGLVLVIVLALIVATALAVATLRDTAQLIAQTEQDDGFFAYWPNEKKVTVVSALIEQGYIDGTTEMNQIMSEIPNSDKAGHVADEAISKFVGQDVTEIGFMTIMQAAWGPFDQWTHEEHAWYSQVMENVGVESDGKTFFVEPIGSVDEQKAVTIARSAIATSYDVDESALDDYSYVVSFQIPEFAEQGDDQPYWYVAYTAPETLPKKSRLFSDIELFINPDTGELLESVDEIRANYANAPRRPSNELYQAIDRYYARATEMGVHSFRKWSLELRAEYSREIAPKVKAILESGDLTELTNCGNPDNTVIAQSTYTYGVPQSDAISQDDAFAVAKTALTGQYNNLTPDIFDKYGEIDVYFDITEEATPLWKFFFNPKSLRVQDLENGYDNPLFNLCYKVEINSLTGEIVRMEEFSFQTLGHDLEYDLKWY